MTDYTAQLCRDKNHHLCSILLYKALDDLSTGHSGLCRYLADAMPLRTYVLTQRYQPSAGCDVFGLLALQPPHTSELWSVVEHSAPPYPSSIKRAVLAFVAWFSAFFIFESVSRLALTAIKLLGTFLSITL